MKIAVCIKRTPDSESRFKIASSATSIDETGLKFDIDDFASYAVEVALQLNEKQGPGETVVSRRRPGRRAGDAAQGDEHGRRSRRAAQDRRGPVRRTRRREGARRGAQGRRLRSHPVRQARVRHVAPASSARRRPSCSALPCVTAASKLDIANGKRHGASRARGRGGDGRVPAARRVTIDEGIARPRYPSLKGIMAAKKKPLEIEAGAARRGARHGAKAMELPPERPAGRIIGEGVGRGAGARATPPDRSEGALMANVLVFAETRGTALRKVALEAVTAARALADATGGGEVHALVAGHAGRRRGRRAARRSTAPTSWSSSSTPAFANVRSRGRRGDGRRAREAAELSRRRARLLGAGARPRPARSPRSSMRRSSTDVTTIRRQRRHARREASRLREQGDRDARGHRAARDRVACARARSPRRKRRGRRASESIAARVPIRPRRSVVVKEIVEGGDGQARPRRRAGDRLRRPRAQGAGELQARRRSRGGVRQRGGRRDARGDRRRLAPAQRSDRTDGPAGEPAAVRRGRHLRRDPASRRHAHVEDDRRDQQGQGSADLQGRGLRDRRRRARGRSGADESGERGEERGH